MNNIKDLNAKHFIIKGKAVIMIGNKRHVLKVYYKYFSNYPMSYVQLNGTRYQIADKTFDFIHGIL